MIDQDLLTLLQYALVEPPDGGASFPSGLWTRDEVLHALNTRMAQLLRDTQAIISIFDENIGSIAPGSPIIGLPTDWIATVAATWRSVGTPPVISPLMPTDTFEADLLGPPNWDSAGQGTPIALIEQNFTSLTARLVPNPMEAGNVFLYYVALPVQASGAGNLLSLPDELLDGVKYGALADLLGKVGRGGDPTRAAYCQERFEQTDLAIEIILGGWA
jgi:hypothetical protein